MYPTMYLQSIMVMSETGKRQGFKCIKQKLGKRLNYALTFG